MMRQSNGEATILAIVAVGLTIWAAISAIDFLSQPIEDDIAYKRLQWELESTGEIREGVSCTTYGEGGRFEFTTCR